ncbi:MAG: hypothetical protein HN757_12425 [Calditrichaeota bacterium]|nr:hypothetical protein [Calditrichota bacterium]
MLNFSVLIFQLFNLQVWVKTGINHFILVDFKVVSINVREEDKPDSGLVTARGVIQNCYQESE